MSVSPETKPGRQVLPTFDNWLTFPRKKQKEVPAESHTAVSKNVTWTPMVGRFSMQGITEKQRMTSFWKKGRKTSTHLPRLRAMWNFPASKQSCKCWLTSSKGFWSKKLRIDGGRCCMIRKLQGECLALSPLIPTSEASKGMAALPAINRRVLWSNEEEQMLIQEVGASSTCWQLQAGAPDFVSFQRTLEKYRDIFHSSRTPKSLEAHYYRLKRSRPAPDSITPSTSVTSPNLQNNQLPVVGSATVPVTPTTLTPSTPVQSFSGSSTPNNLLQSSVTNSNSMTSSNLITVI